MIHLDYRDARPIYAQIVDGVRAQISAGVLKADEKLPSVRELAVQLSINPNTIQRAYRQLEAEGWVATVPGKGCFACGTPQFAADTVNKLYSAFDLAAENLLRCGITREALIAHLQKEGEDHA